MKWERAVDLVEHVLRNLECGQNEWPLSSARELYVFGSFARGAMSPGDVDLDVEYDSSDRRFLSLFMNGRDYHAPIRRALTGGRRGYQILFQFRDRADFDLTLLWRKGDSLATALERLHSIKPDPSAGRAARDSMLPQFEGLEDSIPRRFRAALYEAVSAEAVAVDRLSLSEGPIESQVAVEHLARRWKSSSPLFRTATAVVRYWEQRGIDPGRGHLHGRDIRDRDTPYFAGLRCLYVGSIPACLTRFGGVEWVEVLHPTRSQPLEALRIVPLDRESLERLAQTPWH